MTIEAKVICDSISEAGIRITTFQLRYPRFIHSEFMTHRVFSRNASSSRAIPVKRLVEDIRRDPAMPVYWGKNQPGMKAREELTATQKERAQEVWIAAMENAILSAIAMDMAGAHKQIVNRMLEPWAHINVICTATSYDNFFELRSHPDAQPEIKALSDAMKDAMDASTPELLHDGQWHLPYIQDKDWIDVYHMLLNSDDRYTTTVDVLKKVSTARNARVSYLTHDGRETTPEEDIKLHDELVVSKPLHASPAEHVCTPDVWDDKYNHWRNPELHGNTPGWIQYRRTLPGGIV